MSIGSSQLAIGVHKSAPFELTWREDGARNMRTIKPGHVNITAAGAPLYLQWDNATPTVSVIAIEQARVRHILMDAGVNPDVQLRRAFGIRDPVVRQLSEACEVEFTESGASGRLFADGLATALVTHIYRSYADGAFPKVVMGGLSPRDTKCVLAYIEEHLQGDIDLSDLASSVHLSIHYFTAAFKKTVGMPPYRYVLNRRVQQAKEMLLKDELSTSQIAEAVGFSSQSQFTTSFRKFVGTTPGKFRRESM